MADRKISDLTALTTPASGDYLPIVDISEASAANKNKRITIEELLRGAPDGTAGAPGIGFESDPNTGIYSPGADALGLATAGTERLRITSAGLVGIGTSSPGYPLTVNGRISYSGAIGEGADTTLSSSSTTLIVGDSATWQNLALKTNGSNRVYINAAGNVGIGTTSPITNLHVVNPTTTSEISLSGGTTAANYCQIGFYGGSTRNAEVSANSAFLTLTHQNSGVVRVETGGTERARIDSSGRLLVGTSSALTGGDSQYSILQVLGSQLANDYAIVVIGREEAATAITSGENLGQISFTDSSGNEFGTIKCTADANAGSGDYPGRLVFSTTADGASSPTERMRISAAGNFIFKAAGYLEYGDYGTPNSGNPGIRFTGDQYPRIDISSGYFGDTGSRVKMNFINGNGTVGSIVTDGSATAYNTSSDYRLKENVAPVTDGINRLQQLKPSRFNFITDPTKTVDGFLAHEVQTVVPEAITGEKDAVDDEGNPVYQGIDQSKLVPLLTAALQEALAEIESLKARLTAAGI